MPPLIFRRGLDLKAEVAGALAADYHSALVEEVKANDYRYEGGRLTIHLAREFGFCYGVDRAVDYAYQARKRFADRRVFLTGEIIHNPHVNQKLRDAGIRFLSDPGESYDALGPDDVVILPAFGVTTRLLLDLQQRGCSLVDTTCGSVLNVWKNVRRYADEGFTSIIHGKVHHEETQATASQALDFPDGRFLVVFDTDEAMAVCDYIRHGGNPAAFLARFGHAASTSFDPDRHLARIGLANQTTMLMTESLAIGELFRQAMIDRHGEDSLGERFRAFDTICSATQERQDAVVSLLDEHRLDVMVVVGGYNSSNTCNLTNICAARVPTFHIADPTGLESSEFIRHRPATPPGAPRRHVDEVRSTGWLPVSGPVAVGLTAGASTPNNIIGEVIIRLEALARDRAEPVRPRDLAAPPR